MWPSANGTLEIALVHKIIKMFNSNSNVEEFFPVLVAKSDDRRPARDLFFWKLAVYSSGGKDKQILCDIALTICPQVWNWIR